MKFGSAALTIVLATVLTLGLAWSVSAEALPLMGLPAPLALALLALALQWVAFVPACALKTEQFYDLTGSATFLCVTGLAVWVAHGQGQLSTRGLVSACLVGIWSLRLGAYLFGRIRRTGHDARFEQIKVSGPRFLVSWTLQGVWAALTSLPVLVVLTAESASHAVDTWAVVGWLTWLAGFTIEVVADRQKAAFRARETGPRTWIDEGLWAHARHPNYFGEMLLWVGLFVAHVPVYRGAQWLVIVSPLLVILLLTRVSGIPLLQAQGQARWGNDPDYQRYLARTRLLVPLPRGRSRAAP